MQAALDKKVPEWARPTTGGQTVSSTDLLGKKVVLYFYPRDNTPGCTTESQDFARVHKKFVANDTVVLGASMDTLSSHEKFKAKHEMPFELISDEDETICRLFDVIRLKKMYGKEFEGIERSTFLIDSKGVLRREWRKVKVKGHADEVLAAATALK